jgi:hypothetical protein
VLSVEEVTLLGAAMAPKYKAAFATAHGAGLRASDVVTLKGGTGVASELREQPSVRLSSRGLWIVRVALPVNCRKLCDMGLK